jgi:tetratricopeptide (TPR) repeat protein
MLNSLIRAWGIVLAVALIPVGVSADDLAPDQSETLPGGLEPYLEARLLEAQGRFREAMEAYEQAVREAPDVNEVRLAYASFLVDVGMADRAAGILKDVEDLDAEGLKVRALALAQLASRKPDLAEETEAALRAALAVQDADPNLLFALAQILQNTGELEEAETIAAGLRQGRSGNPRLTAFHAGLLRDLGRTEEATELYSQCVDGGPAASMCRDALVEMLVELDRPGDAGEVMLGWLGDVDLDSLMRAAVLLWEGGRLEESLDTVQRVLVKAPDSVRAQKLEAHLLSTLGLHDEAVDRLQRLLRKNPNDIDLILAMAWSQSRSGDHEKGRKYLDRAWERAEIEADSIRAVRCAVTASRLELIAGNPLVSREWLERVHDLSLVGADYVRLLAETYRQQEEWQDGITGMVRIQPALNGRAQTEAEALEAEFRMRSGDSRAWRRLRPLLDGDQIQNVLIALQVLQTVELWEEVDREAATAIERFGEDRDLRFIRAAALERLDRVEAASELFQDLVEEEPNDANAANYLGYMWADREMHLDRALELITHAVALDPENSAYLDSLGWVHYRRGDLDQAEHWLRRAVDLGGNSGDGTIYCHLGEVLLSNGDREEGRRYLLIGLDMGCEDPDHVRSLLEREDDAAP